MTSPYPPIPNEAWRRDAACSLSPDPQFWDDKIDDEPAEYRTFRHEHAKAICRRCPVAFQCATSVDMQWDEGIRAGQLLPPKKNAARPVHERVA